MLRNCQRLYDYSFMPKKRILSPPSVWDEALVREVFRDAGVKESHLPKIYK